MLNSLPLSRPLMDLNDRGSSLQYAVSSTIMMTPCDYRCSSKYFIRLRGAWNGKRYALPGEGEILNDWRIPTHRLKIKNLIGRKLVLLRKCCCGDHLIPAQNCRECKEDMPPTECRCCKRPFRLARERCSREHCKGATEVTISEAPVNALVDEQMNIRTMGTLEDAFLADSEGIVKVTFGTEECHEAFEEIPPVPLDSIRTPSTPSPCVTP